MSLTDPMVSRRLDALRAEATLLLKLLTGAEAARARHAAARLRKLPALGALGIDAVLARAAGFQHKHALQVVAVEHGQASWAALKAAIEAGRAEAVPALDLEPFIGAGGWAFLNRWFARVDEAEAWLAREGGYLLPYRRQCVLMEADAVAALGFDPADPDWAAMGWNWVRPLDVAARDRLARRWAVPG